MHTGYPETHKIKIPQGPSAETIKTHQSLEPHVRHPETPKDLLRGAALIAGEPL